MSAQHSFVSDVRLDWKHIDNNYKKNGKSNPFISYVNDVFAVLLSIWKLLNIFKI
jgi:hypothetical protein